MKTLIKRDTDTQFDVIVVGGGHAGVEAALAASRMGAHVLLVTHNIDTLGQMSCNPAIGGIGKSHLVKEIDAMGGVMAQAADRAGIHFRVLNASKGAAVRATRAQTDRVLYRKVIRQFIESQPSLKLFQQAVVELLMDDKKQQVRGVVTQSGLTFRSKSVVLTTGTFLGGCIHIGNTNYSAGRAGDPPSNRLAQQLRAYPFQMGRLKTGTPPRLDKRTIDVGVMEIQPGDAETPVFSFIGSVKEHPEQVDCYITRTNEGTHTIIQENLSRSALFNGTISGVGPRYCPSIEDKIVRFSEQLSHQLFVEPEGLNVQEVYPNGISTSLPFEVQQAFVRSIKGFESAHITRPGYAIEYDYFDPRGLKPWLETKLISRLFFAGQINGTTGYEEAAAQGLIAGINAVLISRDQTPWYPIRNEAYIGVLLDDLVTLGAEEPYRMFTSRAEYRLLLRQDNADSRLTAIGRRLGLVDDKRWQSFSLKKVTIDELMSQLKRCKVQPDSPLAFLISNMIGSPLVKHHNLYDLLRRPELRFSKLLETLLTSQLKDGKQIAETFLLDNIEKSVVEYIEVQSQYAGYIERQVNQVAQMSRHEKTRLPDNINYDEVAGLSNEVREKLKSVKPLTLGQARRIPGITPAAISILTVYLKKFSLI